MGISLKDAIDSEKVDTNIRDAVIRAGGLPTDTVTGLTKELYDINVGIDQNTVKIGENENRIYDVENCCATGGGGGSAPVFIVKPAITYPIDGESAFSGAITSTAYRTSDTFLGSHTSSDWEIARDADFIDIVESSYADFSNLTSYTPTSLTGGNVYFARVRYRSDNIVSQYSQMVRFAIDAIYIRTPTVTVEGYPDNTPLGPVITSSTFSVVGDATQTHESTTWRVYDENTDTVVWESVDDTVNLTSIQVPEGNLVNSTEYYFRCQHKSQTLESAVGQQLSRTIDFTASSGYQYIMSVSESDGPDAMPIMNGSKLNSDGTILVTTSLLASSNNQKTYGKIYNIDPNTGAKDFITEGEIRHPGAEKSISINDTTGDIFIGNDYHGDSIFFEKTSFGYSYSQKNMHDVKSTYLFSNNTKALLAIDNGSSEGTLRVFDATYDNMLEELFVLDGEISQAAISNDENIMVVLLAVDNQNGGKSSYRIFKRDGSTYTETEIIVFTETYPLNSFDHSTFSINTDGSKIILGIDGEIREYLIDTGDGSLTLGQTIVSVAGAATFGAYMSATKDLIHIAAVDELEDNDGYKKPMLNIYEIDGGGIYNRIQSISPIVGDYDNQEFGYSHSFSGNGQILSSVLSGRETGDPRAAIYKKQN